jgi:hypothetical protein
MYSTKDPFPAPSQKRWLCVLLGVACWAVLVIVGRLVYPVIESQSRGGSDYSALGIVLIILLVGLLFVVLDFAVRGCDLLGQYKSGTYGYLIKCFGLFVAALIGSMIGLTAFRNPTDAIALRILFVLISLVFFVPIFLWTGRGVLRRFSY